MARWEIRAIRLDGNVAFVPLTKGYEAIIDADDVWLVEGFNWTAKKRPRSVYALRRELGVLVLLHRMLLDAPPNLQVDHINGDGLDNRRCNLRLASNSENSQNRRRSVDNKSGFKGVTLHRPTGKWQARIQANDRPIFLGLFASPEDAHAAYVDAARRFFGDFARRD